MNSGEVSPSVSVGNESAQDESGLALRLHLRPGFITDGPDGILNSPGTTVQLKNVAIHHTKGIALCLRAH